MTLIRTQVLLESDTVDKLKILAARQGRSVSELVRELVKVGLEREQMEELQRISALLKEFQQIRTEVAAQPGEIPSDILEKTRNERQRELGDALWGQSS
ncbi:MAG: DUF6364 family protein [Anaerolineales bacterium]|nr:DUF6364 family protein [Anaerolineales bacterium]